MGGVNSSSRAAYQLKALSIYDLKRRDIVEMLDAIEDADKAVTADRVLAYVHLGPIRGRT